MTTQPTKTGFIPGTVYHGSLAVAHGSFPVRCVRRTEKSVWFEHVTMPKAYGGPIRCKIRRWEDGSEAAMPWRWYVSSDTDTRNPADQFDPYTI